MSVIHLLYVETMDHPAQSEVVGAYTNLSEAKEWQDRLKMRTYIKSVITDVSPTATKAYMHLTHRFGT